MISLIDRLINQLDALISFLALSREEVFQLLNDNRLIWFTAEENAFPNAYSHYRKQVNQSAFLLGYSYFESFLTDLLTAVLRNRPSMLSNDKSIKYSVILNSSDLSDLIDKIINREIRDLIYKSMEDIIKDLRSSKFNFTIESEEELMLCKASLIRNCILHNSSMADSRLAKLDEFNEGVEFELSTDQIHSYGIVLRALSRRMFSEAQTNHNI